MWQRILRVLSLTACLLMAVDVAAQTPVATIERGRALLDLGGCHDCHTPGFAAAGGQAPESAWLIGDRLGWNGPWGTSYASNLRLRLGTMQRAEWIAFARSMKARPPMPYWVLNRMSDADLGAIWELVQVLGKAGEPMPAALPPGVEPPDPVIRFPAPAP